jgi:hypothetical protein
VPVELSPFVWLGQYANYHGERHFRCAHQVRGVPSTVRVNGLKRIFNI